VTVEYRPTPDSEWRFFADGVFEEESIRLANAACGYEKYRLVADYRHSAFGPVEKEEK
jgi:hypothetical protein